MKRKKGPNKYVKEAQSSNYPVSRTTKSRVQHRKGLGDVQQNGNDTCRFMPFQTSEVSYWLFVYPVLMLLSILFEGRKESVRKILDF